MYWASMPPNQFRRECGTILCCPCHKFLDKRRALLLLFRRCALMGAAAAALLASDNRALSEVSLGAG